MPIFKHIMLLLLLLCNSICFYAYGQKPTITPKTNPILPLDNTGNYIILPGDVANYGNYNPDSPLVVKFKPQFVNCDLRGNQSIHVKALTNGADPGNASISGVGFPGMITGITYDSKGNLFVVEDRSYYIRKITPGGDVTIFAGIGISGSSDGAIGTASFGALGSVIADVNDNIYVTDYTYNKIRKITPAGVVSTLAGTGFPGHTDGPGDKATFVNPQGLDIDADGNLYIADTGNSKVRKITPQGMASTIATSNGRLWRVAAGPDGYIYWINIMNNVSDKSAQVIYRAKPGGPIEIWTGNADAVYEYKDGPLPEARFQQTFGLKFHTNGSLFLIDDARAIRQISPDGIVSTFYANQGIFLNIAEDPCGNIALANGENIFRLTLGKQLSVIAGGIFPIFTGKIPASVCQFTEADIPVVVQSTPTLPHIDNKTVSGCATLADYTLHLATTDNCPDATITYMQTPAAGTPFTNTNPVTVTITATDNTGGTDSKTFTVTNTSIGVITPSVIVSAANSSVCEGEQASFHAEVTNVDAGTTYQWQINGVNAGTNSPDFTSSTLHNNDVVNCIVTTGGGCGVSNPDGAGVTAVINPKPFITLNPSEQILAGTNVTLNPTVTGNIISYKWEPAEGLNDANSQFPVASPAVTTTYKLTVTTDQGCHNDASVTVTVVNHITIPNTFTPNADGYNDLWAIKYLDAYTNCQVSVYNRNGGLVYQSKGYNTAWNGTSGGKPLPAGVYYYIIDLKDGKQPLSGNVTIIR